MAQEIHDAVSQIFEGQGIKEKASKLSSGLSKLAADFDAMSARATKTARFVKRHPYVAAAALWGVKKVVGGISRATKAVSLFPQSSAAVQDIMQGESVNNVVDKLLDTK